MLGTQRFLRSIQLRNLLSFGPETSELELKALNVLIGPNGSGKSNLLEAISLLQAAPRNLLDPIQAGGGVGDLLWKGADRPTAEINVIVDNPQGKIPLRHRLSLTMVAQRLEIVDESIENESPDPAKEQDDVYFYYRYQQGRPVLNVKTSLPMVPRARRELRREDLPVDQSVLSQRKDPDQYPEVTYLGRQYANLKLYREWSLGRRAEPRRPQPADTESDFLREDASNLALVLNELEHTSNLRGDLVEKLRIADDAIADFSTRVHGGTIQLFLHYRGLSSPVPVTRLSDGTIRYLCLLAILCHPHPPPLVCLEEPELGLHPDLLPSLASLLIEASHRVQLIVTTHSDTLVDALSHVPEAVVVCEKVEGCSQMRRTSPEELSDWLTTYGLGQLWRRGDIGGNRW
ncbi:MAG TPA: chromosome segregation protein SMC [Solibacterales bacterium]|nr:chromosome segregation protein SMC [Bryobacterales bacterium]